MKIERRFLHELRAEGQGNEMSLVGYAAKFGTQSEDLGGFRETVMPGAFARSLREGADVKCLMNHSADLVMGRTKNGTLKLEEDATGLRFRCVLPNTQAARDLHTLVARGDVDACSFAFTARGQSWEDVRSENGDMYASRKLHDVDLQDVSAVTYPAYPQTEVHSRSEAQEFEFRKFIFPEGEPVEIRSSINSLVEKRGVGQGIPMPYAISLPQPFDSDMKQEWWDEFIDAYKDCVKRQKMKGAVAIAAATAIANQKVQPQTEVDPAVSGQSKNPTEIPHTVVPTGSTGETPKESDLERALETDAEFRGKYKFQKPEDAPDSVPADNKAQWVSVWNSAYKKAIKDGKSEDEANKSAFAQAMGVAGPKSEKKSLAGCDCRCGNCMEGRHVECSSAEGRCPIAQQRDHTKKVSDPSSDEYDPDDPDYDDQWDDSDGTEDRKDKTDVKDKSKDKEPDEDDAKRGDKTKKIGARSLTSENFAWVGDEEDPSTWKLPVHDDAHARNALAFFNKTQNIPSDKREGVWRKIVGECRKFGVQVSEENSLRAGMLHSVTESAMKEIDKDEEILAAMRAKARLIEIDLS